MGMVGCLDLSGSSSRCSDMYMCLYVYTYTIYVLFKYAHVSSHFLLNRLLVKVPFYSTCILYSQKYTCKLFSFVNNSIFTRYEKIKRQTRQNDIILLVGYAVLSPTDLTFLPCVRVFLHHYCVLSSIQVVFVMSAPPNLLRSYVCLDSK